VTIVGIWTGLTGITRNDKAISDPHTLQATVACTNSSQSSHCAVWYGTHISEDSLASVQPSTNPHFKSKSKSHYDWRSVSQSVSKSWCRAPSGLMTRYLLLSWQLRSCFFVGRPLWREAGSVFYICCWPLPAQSFLGPSPLVLAAIFYCLRFETSHFVASYDSQGHGGGIRPHLHTGYCW
jgi:hypothetical protein